jgi:hypothetical protein
MKKLTADYIQGMLYYDWVQNLSSSSLLTKNIKIETHRTKILPVVLYGCGTWPHIESGTQFEGVREQGAKAYTLV